MSWRDGDSGDSGRLVFSRCKACDVLAPGSVLRVLTSAPLGNASVVQMLCSCSYGPSTSQPAAVHRPESRLSQRLRQIRCCGASIQQQGRRDVSHVAAIFNSSAAMRACQPLIGQTAVMSSPTLCTPTHERHGCNARASATAQATRGGQRTCSGPSSDDGRARCDGTGWHAVAAPHAVLAAVQQGPCMHATRTTVGNAAAAPGPISTWHQRVPHRASHVCRSFSAASAAGGPLEPSGAPLPSLLSRVGSALLRYVRQACWPCMVACMHAAALSCCQSIHACAHAACRARCVRA